jgi:hypothetical protein
MFGTQKRTGKASLGGRKALGSPRNVWLRRSRKAGRVRVFVACLASLGLCVISFTASAHAAVHRTSLTIPLVVDAGTRLTVSYELHIARGDHAVLQTKARRRWATITSLKSSSHSITLSPLRAGTYRFRIAILSAQRRVVATSRTATVTFVHTPRVSWTLPATGNAGQALSFFWRASKVPRGARIVVQQQQGTAHVWRTIAALLGSSGTSALPTQAIGKNEQFRIAVVAGPSVLANQASSVSFFGQVAFSSLDGDAGDSAGTYTTPTATFTSEFYVYANEAAPALTVSAADNNCSHVVVDYILGDPDTDDYSQGETSDSATVSVLQESANAVSSSAAFNQLGTVSADVTPGQSWSVSAQHSPTGYLDRLYLNGYAICDSTTPIIFTK